MEKNTKCFIHGYRNPAVTPLLHWSKQKCPSNQTWRIFVQIIREIFCKGHTLQLKNHWVPGKKMLKHTQNGTTSMTTIQVGYINTMTDYITNGPYIDH